MNLDNYGGAKAMDLAVSARQNRLEEARKNATCAQCLHFVRCDLPNVRGPAAGWCRMNDEFYYADESVGELDCQDYEPRLF